MENQRAERLTAGRTVGEVLRWGPDPATLLQPPDGVQIPPGGSPERSVGDEGAQARFYGSSKRSGHGMVATLGPLDAVQVGGQKS